MHALGQELLHTWRTVRARPGATMATVAVLALGIGLTSAIFALADPFLLRPLPYADPDRLVVISLQSENRRPGPFPALSDLASRTELFAVVAAYTPVDVQMLRLRLPESDVLLATAAVSRSFFDVLGVPLSLPAEWDAAAGRGETPIVVLPDADIRVRNLPVGTGVRTQDDVVIRIVGALREGFVFPRNRVSPALGAITPLGDGPLLDVRISPRGSVSSTSRDVIGRLRDGVTPELAESVLGPPESDERAYSLQVRPLSTYLTARLKPLALGAMAAGLLIALACAANVANLLATRSAFRATELATRKALGASRLDLARLVFLELALLSLAGVAAGLACARLALGIASAVIPAEFIALGAPAVGWRVTTFGIGLGLVIMMAGALPAAALWRLTPNSLLAQRAIVESRRVRLLRFAMAAGQSAVAMVLLAGAALLGRSFLNLVGQETGVADESVVVSVSYPSGHAREPLQRDIESTLNRLRRIPTVSVAAAATGTMIGGSMAGTAVRAGGQSRPMQIKSVTPGYFEAIGTPIIAGRALDARDSGSQGLVVNRRAAAELWPEATAVGRSIPWGETTATIVGVAADTFEQALDVQPRPMVFSVLDAPSSGGNVNFVLRTTASADVIRRHAERAVTETNRDAIVTDVSDVGGRLATSVRDRTFATLVATMFAIAGVGVCAFGLVGVVSFVVARRTREIAIRSAIGARPRHVRILVMRQALTAACVGTAIGLTAGWWTSRWLETLLYGIEAGDAPTLVGGAFVMLAVVAAASWFPTHRALTSSPTIALKAE